MSGESRHIALQSEPAGKYSRTENGEQHHQNSEQQGAEVAVIADPAFAAVFSGAVEIGHERLNSGGESGHQQGAHGFDRRNKRIGCESVDRTVTQSLEVVQEQHGDDRKLISESRNTVLKDPDANLFLRTQFAEPQIGPGRKKVADPDRTNDDLGKHRRQRRAAETEAERENEQIIKQDIQQKPDDHKPHSAEGMPVIAHDCDPSHSEHLCRSTCDQRDCIFAGTRKQFRFGTHQLQDRCEKQQDATGEEKRRAEQQRDHAAECGLRPFRIIRSP